MTAPICATCRHHLNFFGYQEEPVCTRNPPMTNTVTGQPFYMTCSQERHVSIWSRVIGSKQCGETGRYYEPGKRIGGAPPEFRWETPGDDQ